MYIMSCIYVCMYVCMNVYYELYVCVYVYYVFSSREPSIISMYVCMYAYTGPLTDTHNGTSCYGADRAFNWTYEMNNTYSPLYLINSDARKFFLSGLWR